MSWLRFALRDARLPKGKDLSKEKFLVSIMYLDHCQEDFPISKGHSFAALANAIGPSNLVLLRDLGGIYEVIRERGSVYDALVQWKREGDEHPIIVAPFYKHGGPAGQDVLTARTIGRNSYAVVPIKRPDNEEEPVKITFYTTAVELARHLSVTRCIGIFSATRTADARHFSQYELLDRDCNISRLVSEWADLGVMNKVIVFPLVRFGGFSDDDGEPSNVEEEDGFDSAEDVAQRIHPEIVCYACGGSGGEIGSDGYVEADPQDNESETVALSPPAKVAGGRAPGFQTVVLRTPHFATTAITAQKAGSPDSDVSEDTVLPSFEELSLRDKNVAEVASEKPVDPVYELRVDAGQIIRFVAKAQLGPVMSGLEKFRLQYGISNRRATVEQTVRALVQEAIRLAGKEEQQRLLDISEEEMYAALLCGETDAQQQRDLVQLDVPLLACTAVSEVLSEAKARHFDSRGATVRSKLPKIRKRLRPGQRGDVAAAKAESWALMEKFHPVRLVLSVSEQVELAAPALATPAPVVSALREIFEQKVQSPPTPAPASHRPTVEASRPLVHPSLPTPSPNAILFADKVAAVGEVPAEISTELVSKGLLVEGMETSSIVLAVRDNNYHLRRWITRPATSLNEVLHYIVLAVLCPGSQLRDLLLEADRANGGDVSAHFDECKEGYKQILEGYRVHNQRAWAAYEQELEEERKYPPVFDGKVEIA